MLCRLRMLGGRVGETCDACTPPYPCCRKSLASRYASALFTALTNVSAIPAARVAPGTTSSSSFKGGVGGGSKGIVLGEDRAPTADPASPRRLLFRLAARRSPDRFVRRSVGVELRLLARLRVRLSSGVTFGLALKLDRLLMALGERVSETTRLSERSSSPGVSLDTGLLTDLKPSLLTDEDDPSSRMAFGVSARLCILPAGSIGVMFVASPRLLL